MKSKRLFIALVLVLIGCTPQPALSTTTPVIVSDPTLTPTVTPTSMPTVTPTPVKLAHEPITLNNAKQLTKLKTLGFGEPLELRYTPDGTRIVLVMRDKVCFLDAKSLDVLSCIEANVHFAELSADVQTLALLNYKTLDVLDTVTGEVLTHIQLPAELLPQWMTTLKNFLSSNGKYALAPTVDGLYVWDAQTGDLILTFDGEFHGRSYSFSPDGRSLVVVKDNSTTFWDLETRSEAARIGLSELPGIYDPLNYFFSPQGTYLAVSVASSVHVYRVSDREHIWYWKGNSPISDVAFSGDDSLISVGAVSDIKLNVWDLNNGQIVQSLHLSNPLEHGVGSVRISPNGNFISAAGEPWFYDAHSKRECSHDAVNTTLNLWSIETGELILKSPRQGICDTYPIYFQFSPDSQAFLYFSADPEKFAPADLNLFSLTGKVVTANLPLLMARDAAMKDENTLIVGAGDGRLFEMNVLTGESRLLVGDNPSGFDGSDPLISIFELSPDAQKIALGTTDARLLIYDMQSGNTQELWTGQQNVTTMSFSADNRYLAFDGDGYLQIWDFLESTFMYMPSPIQTDEVLYINKENDFLTVGLSTYFNGSENTEVTLWRPRILSQPLETAILLGPYRGFTVSHAGDFFISDITTQEGVMSPLVYLPNIFTGNFMHSSPEMPADYVFGSAISPDDRLYAAWIRLERFNVKEECRVEIWDTQQNLIGKLPVHCINFPLEYEHKLRRAPMFFSADGTLLFVGTDIGYGMDVYAIP